MQLQTNAHQRSYEYRRYFPDWTDRSLRAGDRSLQVGDRPPRVRDRSPRVGQELEADHNSYLAGGYAEEFGYLAQAEFYRGVPLIDGASPDDDALRLVQRAGMHPGYPLKPYPISVEREETERRAPSRSSGGMPHVGLPEVRDNGNFVRVTERPYEREHRQLRHRLAVAAVQFRAAVVALRWELPSLRKGRQ